MEENYLITGYHGKPHVTAENDRGIHAGIFGSGKYVLPVGMKFHAEYIGNNTVRMYDGKLMNNGAAAGIPAGRFIDFTIPEASSGKQRNDLIVFQYDRNTETLIESGSFRVVRGSETDGTAEPPALISENLLSGEAVNDQMALWSINVSGVVISDPVQVFAVSKTLESVAASNDAIVATSTDGRNFYANSDGFSGLHNGMSITVVPNIENDGDLPPTDAPYSLNINDTGAVLIRRSVSGQARLTIAIDVESIIVSGCNIRLTYNGTYWIVGNVKPAASDLYGDVPIDGGGTGASTLEKAQKNLQIYPATNSTEYPGHYCRTVDGETEWINPPTVLGVEFRTTERFCGFPVYTKSVKLEIPGSGSHTATKIAVGATGLLRYTACIWNTADTAPAAMPFPSADIYPEISTYILRMHVNNTSGDIPKSPDGAVQAWYIKDMPTNIV